MAAVHKTVGPVTARLGQVAMCAIAALILATASARTATPETLPVIPLARTEEKACSAVSGEPRPSWPSPPPGPHPHLAFHSHALVDIRKQFANRGKDVETPLDIE